MIIHLYEDRMKMEKLYPFFEFIYKENHQKGHVYSMNIIYDHLEYYKYLVHIEDDFHFIEQRNYITESINILNEDENIGQVLFNNHYAELEPYKMYIKGGIKKVTQNGIVHNIHEYDKDAQNKKYGYINNYYWPHFSFRPSVHRCSAILDVGLFYNTNYFEYSYAFEYVDRNYKSALFETFSCIHIGKKTWEHGDNSYNKNNITQFIFSLMDLNVCIIKSSPENWKSFKVRSRNVMKFLKPFNSHKECITFIINDNNEQNNTKKKIINM